MLIQSSFELLNIDSSISKQCQLLQGGVVFPPALLVDFFLSEGSLPDIDFCFLSILQKIHARILGLWGVKIVVVAVFVAFCLASIVSISSGTSLLWYLDASEPHHPRSISLSEFLRFKPKSLCFF